MFHLCLPFRKLPYSVAWKLARKCADNIYQNSDSGERGVFEMNIFFMINYHRINSRIVTGYQHNNVFLCDNPNNCCCSSEIIPYHRDKVNDCTLEGSQRDTFYPRNIHMKNPSGSTTDVLSSQWAFSVRPSAINGKASEVRSYHSYFTHMTHRLNIYKVCFNGMYFRALWWWNHSGKVNEMLCYIQTLKWSETVQLVSFFFPVNMGTQFGVE